MVEIERRRSSRLGLPFKFKGLVTFTRKGQEIQERVETKDISVSGGYFIGSVCPTTGEHVSLFLHWPPEGGKADIELNAAGKVLRVDQLSEDKWGFAVGFDDMPDVLEEIL